MATHKVTNQPPPLAGSNAWASDPLLKQLSENLGSAAHEECDALGRYVMSHDAQEMARLANLNTPSLRTHDRQGNRIDLVEFHPAYHALMRRSVTAGLHCSVWESGDGNGSTRHRTRAAKFYMMSQLELGHLCPITMTNASLAALMASTEIFNEWLPKVTTRTYDPSNRPAGAKSGLTIGMGMTEKQGGTDVRANTSTAEPADNRHHRLTGHKWFMSAPASDAFLMLANTGEGASCFLVPRLLSDGSDNGLRFQRLKDKLGNKSNASSEVEFDGTVATMIGEPGQGIKTIMDMVTLTRLDCALGSAGLMRASVSEAVHHCRHRSVFGKKLIDQPLMERVLADLSLDVAAAAALAFRLARAFDNAASNRADAAFARAMTPVVKYWVCKLAPGVINEAMECLGGNGYVEDGPLARHFRESPLNAIWEGSGNVMALDVARVLARNGSLFDEVISEISDLLGPAGQGTADVLRAAVSVAQTDEGSCRILTEQLALAAAAGELKRLGADRIADAFIESRLAGQWRSTYGMLDARHDGRAIIDTLYPAVM